MLQPLNDLCIAANSPTKQTMKDLTRFLDYCATNPDPKIIFRASNMILHIHNDVAHLVAPKGKSWAAGYHFLGNKDYTLHIGPIHVLSKMTKVVMSLGAEAKCSGAFMNRTEACPFQTTIGRTGMKTAAYPNHHQ